VAKKQLKKPRRPIFDAIRKPTAPSSKRFGEGRPDDVARPALRKVKHKKKRDEMLNSEDVQ
jgi:hypothetical protein